MNEQAPLHILGTFLHLKNHKWVSLHIAGSVSTLMSGDLFALKHHELILLPGSVSTFVSSDLSALEHSWVGCPLAKFQHSNVMTFLHLNIHEWAPLHIPGSFSTFKGDDLSVLKHS